MALLSWARGGRVEGLRTRSFWCLQDRWIPLTGGAYILITGGGVKFRYPGGESPVFYIGQSANLRRRLREHNKFANEAAGAPPEERCFYWQKYNYAAEFGERYAIVRTWQGLTPKGLEDLLMARFVRRYLAFPVANGSGAWRKMWQVIRENADA